MMENKNNRNTEEELDTASEAKAGEDEAVEIPVEDGNLEEAEKNSDPDIALKGEEMERKRICQALEKADHNRKQAARLLGISRSTLYEKMDLYGIQTKK